MKKSKKSKSKAKAIDGLVLPLSDPSKGYAPEGCTELMAEDWPPIEKALNDAGWKVIPAK